MRITKVKLDNCACFYDEEAKDVKLGQGINFVIGKNNSGKTALINAISNDTVVQSHRGPNTIPYPLPIVPSENVTEYWIEYRFAPLEVLRILRKYTDRLLIHQFPALADREHLSFERLKSFFEDNLELKYHFRDGNAVAIEISKYETKCDIVNRTELDIFGVNLDNRAYPDES